MNSYNLEPRTLEFAAQVIAIVRRITFDSATTSIRSQLVKSATSVGANYHEANQAESKRDFIHKVSIAGKEAAETKYWLQLLSKLYPEESAELSKLCNECTELMKILITISKRAKGRG